jgi:hypothetical protein
MTWERVSYIDFVFDCYIALRYTGFGMKMLFEIGCGKRVWAGAADATGQQRGRIATWDTTLSRLEASAPSSDSGIRPYNMKAAGRLQSGHSTAPRQRGVPKKAFFAKRTHFCASRRGNFILGKPKTNPFAAYDSGVSRTRLRGASVADWGWDLEELPTPFIPSEEGNGLGLVARMDRIRRRDARATDDDAFDVWRAGGVVYG